MPPSRQSLTAVLCGVALGLFAGRLGSELLALPPGSLPLWSAVALTVLSVLGAVRLTGRFSAYQVWPLGFLLAYVVNPELDLTAALLIAGFVLLLLWQINRQMDQRAFSGRLLMAVALALMAGFLLLYWLTLAPDVLPADSGEFQTVAANLGVAHPPGFPIYTVLAHLMTRLPLGPNPAYRVNLFSALTSILTLGTVFVGVHLQTRRYLPALAAGVVLGTATTFWSQATTANIRSLMALFAALILLAALGFYRAQAEAGAGDRRAQRWLVLLALFLGLGITHHASLLFLGLVALVFLLLIDRTLLRPSRRWLAPLFAFLLGFLPLLYLPLRAHAAARGASPSLATWPGFAEHALALGFRGDLFVYLEPHLFWERLKVMANVLAFQFPLPVLAIMALGLISVWRREWRLGVLLGGTFALFTFVTATYRAPQTVEYMLPAYVALAFLAGLAADSFAARPRAAAYVQPLVSALLLIFAFRQLTQHFPDFQALHNSEDTRRYVSGILDGAPAGAEVLADWHWATPLWYLQEVEGRRPDTAVRFVFPQGEPYGQTWAGRIAAGLAENRPVVSTHLDPDAYAQLPPAQPLDEAFLFGAPARSALPPAYTAVAITLADALDVQGFLLEEEPFHAGGETALTLAWQPRAGFEPGTILFVHVLDADGRLRGQQDLAVRPQQDGLTFTRFALTPQIGALPGPYTLAVGAYAAQPLPDQAGRLRTPLTAIDLEPMPAPLESGHPLQRQLLDSLGSQLAGYDWDRTLPERPRLYLHWRQASGYVTQVAEETLPDLPPYRGPWGVAREDWTAVLTPPAAGHYVPFGAGIIWTGGGLDPAQALAPGEALVLAQHFRSSRPVLRDYAVSVRLIGYEQEGTQWAWWDLDDAIPAMGAIPTLKWIGGSRVRAPHFLTVAEHAPAGQRVGGALTLYDAFTARPLPILDDRLARDFGWVPLGETVVR